MNIKHAQYMLTVIQEGSITGAAKKLYVSQPSLSQMIKLVETNLGTPIFNRNTDPITLTYAGQKYMAAAKSILTINNNLIKEIEEINSEHHGTIRLGIPVQRAMQVMPFILPKFMKEYPHVNFEITESGSATTERLAAEGSLDMALITTHPKYEELEYFLIETEKLVLMTTPNTDIAARIPSGTPIDIAEARKETFICIKQGHSVRATQDKLFIQKDIAPRILLESDSIEVAKRTTLACDAVMIIPENYIAMSPELIPQCVTYPILGIENNRNFYICHRKDQYMTKFMKDFVTMMTEGVQQNTPTD